MGKFYMNQVINNSKIIQIMIVGYTVNYFALILLDCRFNFKYESN